MTFFSITPGSVEASIPLAVFTTIFEDEKSSRSPIRAVVCGIGLRSSVVTRSARADDSLPLYESGTEVDLRLRKVSSRRFASPRPPLVSRRHSFVKPGSHGHPSAGSDHDILQVVLSATIRSSYDGTWLRYTVNKPSQDCHFSLARIAGNDADYAIYLEWWSLGVAVSVHVTPLQR